MYYEINVSKKTNEGYRHFFATNPRSIQTKDKAKILYREFAEKFPYPEYQILVSLYPEQSLPVRTEDLIQ